MQQHAKDKKQRFILSQKMTVSSSSEKAAWLSVGLKLLGIVGNKDYNVVSKILNRR